MTTFVSYLAITAIAALLLGPSLYGILRDRRTDRQLRAVATRLVWLPRQRAGGLPPTPRRHGFRPARHYWGPIAH
ncbi:hypothetical protein OG444_25540 [Streptomyces sp. NBC_01232]|uniref:hypothetical protein n=1 Tax=unclassified Streptomyces TaxID=2593676 RepID=UPI002E1488B4|nr:hypothetical protein OG444_25540 [Streptomyces sp. NBC_01232]